MIKPYFYKQADSRWAKKRYKCTDGGYASVGPVGSGPTQELIIGAELPNQKRSMQQELI